jgi:hypothetical protein
MRGRLTAFREPSVVAVLAAVIVAAALLVLVGSLTRPAEAVVPGQVRVQGFSAFDSTNVKGAQATCPSGKKVIGTGAEIESGGGQVSIFGVEPAERSVVARAYEDETGTNANWSIRVYAICADPLPGLVQITNTSVNNSASPKQVTVACPAGKRLTGTGAQIQIDGPIGQVVLDDVRPSPALGSVLVSAYEDETGTNANWSIVGFAVCADPIPGLVRITNSSAFDSASPKSTSTPCSGKLLTGTGFEIQSGLGQVVLDDLRPHSALTSQLATAYEDETGTAANWRIRGYSICA